MVPSATRRYAIGVVMTSTIKRTSCIVVGAFALAACSRTPSQPAQPSTQSSSPAPTAQQPAKRAPVGFAEHHDDAITAFRHTSGFEGAYRLQEIMGSGVALIDCDNDGNLDIYLVGGAPTNTGSREDRLLRQREDGSFEDITAASGIVPHGFGMGTACADYDNDGDVDLLLTGVNQLQLFRNNGDNTFTDVSESLGLQDQPWSVAAAFADFDNDGWLDLFVVNYVQPDDHQHCFDKSGRPEFCGPQNYQPLADVFYHNDNGSFRNDSARAGIDLKRGPGLGVLCVDFTGDGLLDVYVANDAAANYLWVNQGDGTFLERATQLGCAFNREGAVEASMGLAVGDLAGTGTLDLFMTHLDSETNTLYRRNPDGAFMDITALTGLGPPSLPMTGFGTGMLDADLDGDLDIVVVNGAIKRKPQPFATAVGQEELRPYAEPRQLFINDGNGKFTAFQGDEAGLGAIEVSRGLAVGDINNDGALDLVVVCDGGGARLFYGDPPRGAGFLTVRAYDALHKRDALGALVVVKAGERTMQRYIAPSISYASSSQPIAHFGLGSLTAVDEITIHWPGGDVEKFPGARADSRLKLMRGDGEPAN